MGKTLREIPISGTIETKYRGKVSPMRIVRGFQREHFQRLLAV